MVRNQQWMWTSKHHLKPISYSRWAAAEAAASVPPPGVDGTASSLCLLLDRALHYHWAEASCDRRHRFICEQDHA